MAGEIVKTKGLVLAIHPWSRTSHIVVCLTPDHGCVTTLVKGAVRPKSAFLGQYDLFYVCDLLYYARAKGDLHALREVTPLNLRDALRGRWRETALAGYAAGLVRDHAPPSSEAAGWFDFLDGFLESLTPRPDAPPCGLAHLLRLELGFLKLAGLQPDLSGVDPQTSWTPFAIDLGRCGEGSRTVRLSPATAAILRRPDAPPHTYTDEAWSDAIRFLGVFLVYHLNLAPDIRRTLVHLLSTRPSTPIPPRP